LPYQKRREECVLFLEDAFGTTADSVLKNPGIELVIYKGLCVFLTLAGIDRHVRHPSARTHTSQFPRESPDGVKVENWWL